MNFVIGLLIGLAIGAMLATLGMLKIIKREGWGK